MKRLLLVLLTALLAGGIVLTASVHYHTYKNKQTQQQQRVVADQAQERAVAAGRYAVLQSRYDKLFAECQKGKAAYDALLPATKAKTPLPTCEPAQN